MKKLSSELKTLLEGSIEEWNSYDWSSLEVNQAINCALYLKISNQLDKLKCLVDTLLKLEQDYTVYCVFKRYPELIEQSYN